MLFDWRQHQHSSPLASTDKYHCAAGQRYLHATSLIRVHRVFVKPVVWQKIRTMFDCVSLFCHRVLSCLAPSQGFEPRTFPQTKAVLLSLLPGRDALPTELRGLVLCPAALFELARPTAGPPYSVHGRDGRARQLFHRLRSSLAHALWVGRTSCMLGTSLASPPTRNVLSRH